MTSRINQAARWLATNGPGKRALRQCKAQFELTAVELATVCVMAAQFRRGQQKPDAVKAVIS